MGEVGLLDGGSGSDVAVVLPGVVALADKEMMNRVFSRRTRDPRDKIRTRLTLQLGSASHTNGASRLRSPSQPPA
jgi:hypothetical protein